jgi:hypothetical protein
MRGSRSLDIREESLPPFRRVVTRRKGGSIFARVEARMKETNPEKLALLYERFKDVCLVEKEVWYEIFMPRDVGKGMVLTRLQDRYEVVIDDKSVEQELESAIPLGANALAATIEKYRDRIGFVKKT